MHQALTELDRKLPIGHLLALGPQANPSASLCLSLLAGKIEITVPTYLIMFCFGLFCSPTHVFYNYLLCGRHCARFWESCCHGGDIL